jgi:hypothetical protein
MKQSVKSLPVSDMVSKAIVNQTDIDEASVPAIALFAHGMTQSAVAATLGVAPYVVKGWMSTPGYLSAISVVRENIDAWHKAQLSTAAALAWRKIINLLSEDIKFGEPGYKEQMRMAEVIVMRSSSQKIGFAEEEESGETTTLQVHPASVDLIARRVSEMQGGGVQASARDHNARRVNLDNMPPVIACHPSTEYGKMSRGLEGSYICHVCGKEPVNFFEHIESTHGLNAVSYSKTYGIDDNMFSVEYTR